ncbi:MAG: homoserine dehydrogenase [Chloroflexota bacterium]
MGSPDRIRVVLLGLGTVGTGVARALIERSDTYARRVGVPIELLKVLVANADKKRDVKLPNGMITDNADEALSTDCDIVIEVIGAEEPAYTYIKRAIDAKRYVVTGNKEVMAKHGAQLLSAATKAGVDILYEASVGGGIPIVSPLKRDLSANDITSLRAIINGTTNYILTRMSRDGTDFAEALKGAQDLGYAEADPTNDIEAHDPVYKLAILGSLAFHTTVRPEDVYREGITKLTPRDFRYADELGYRIKLLAIARKDANGLSTRVHPTLIAKDQLLANVDGVLNAVQVEGDLTGRVLFQGAGAGSLPTTSAVMADVLDAARSIVLGGKPSPWRYTADMAVVPISGLISRHYLRLEVADQPGVLAVIARSFGDHGVSIASVIQKETGESQTAELVIMTHESRESDFQASIDQIAKVPEVTQVGSVIRVED